MITKNELLMGRDKQYASDYTKEISDNLDKFLVVLNKIRAAYNAPMRVNSGWRPPSINASTPGAATRSRHLLGLACDFHDPDKKIWNWCLKNLQLLKDLNVFIEDRRWTPTWTHMQLGPPSSGRRIFIPGTQKALAPDQWDGVYDRSFDITAA